MRQRALGIHLRQVLWRGNEHGARQWQLRNHHLDLFAGARRRVDDNHVGGPGDVEDQVAQQP